ncbi:hypothetical protein [Candidatus Poriferisodalis sp.]|uniref:hypothetical protein n=1 Tax=Candidatus Poriferisodalis sp. TaxID=3101277 RepID=UPI003AF5C568
MSRAGDDSLDLPPGHVDHMVDDLPKEHVQRWIDNGGLLVVLASDGLIPPVLETHYREWFDDDPDDNSLGFALPADRRGTASNAADTLMDAARVTGLSDNTTIAVARLIPDRSADSAGSMASES